MSQVEQFIAAATEFSDWCASAPREEAKEAQQVLVLLVRLYSLALQLREPSNINYELDGEGTDDPTWKNVYKRASALPLQHYAEVLDPEILPAKKDQLAIGDLADDIADIHRDLTAGLSLALAGHIAEAEWEFVHSFRFHWGSHATSAIRALHSWISDAGWL